MAGLKEVPQQRLPYRAPRTLLTDELWTKLLAIFLEFDLYDKPNLRKTFEGVLYRMRTGCPWRDLPAAFGKFQVVYKCFNRWSKQEIIQKIFKRLSADADKELLMMDSIYPGSSVCNGCYGM